jgi:hypothetical protein
LGTIARHRECNQCLAFLLVSSVRCQPRAVASDSWGAMGQCNQWPGSLCSQFGGRPLWRPVAAHGESHQTNIKWCIMDGRRPDEARHVRARFWCGQSAARRVQSTRPDLDRADTPERRRLDLRPHPNSMLYGSAAAAASRLAPSSPQAQNPRAVRFLNSMP